MFIYDLLKYCVQKLVKLIHKIKNICFRCQFNLILIGMVAQNKPKYTEK